MTGIRKFEILHFIFDTEVNALEVADAFGLAIENARMILLRAFKSKWLNRQKDNGIYYYRLAPKSWRFYDKFGSFIEHPYYGFAGGKSLKGNNTS